MRSSGDEKMLRDPSLEEEASPTLGGSARSSDVLVVAAELSTPGA